MGSCIPASLRFTFSASLQADIFGFGRSPPLAVQPSFGHFFSRVNDAWISGFRPAHMKGARWVAPSLSNVVVVSVAGGARDYQVNHYDSLVPAFASLGNGLLVGRKSQLQYQDEILSSSRFCNAWLIGLNPKP